MLKPSDFRKIKPKNVQATTFAVRGGMEDFCRSEGPNGMCLTACL